MINIDLNLNERALRRLEELADQKKQVVEELVSDVILEYLEDTDASESAEKALEESKGRYYTTQQVIEKLGL